MFEFSRFKAFDFYLVNKKKRSRITELILVKAGKYTCQVIKGISAHNLSFLLIVTSDSINIIKPIAQ